MKKLARVWGKRYERKQAEKRARKILRIKDRTLRHDKITSNVGRIRSDRNNFSKAAEAQPITT